MYTRDCKDMNCTNCMDSSSAPSSEEESESEMLKHDRYLMRTVEHFISHDMVKAIDDKVKWAALCLQLKDKIHTQVCELTGVLRLREQELCKEIDKRCNDKIFRIDESVLQTVVDRVVMRPERILPSRFEKLPCFTSDFDDLASRLGIFGDLSDVDVSHLSIEQREEYLRGKDTEELKRLETEALVAACSNLSIEDAEKPCFFYDTLFKNVKKETMSEEKKVDQKESKEKAVEPKKCEKGKFEPKENDKKKIIKKRKPATVNKLKVQLLKDKNGKLGKEDDGWDIARNDVLKEVERAWMADSGVKEKRTLNEKAIDPKSLGKRPKKSTSLAEKKKKDEQEVDFNILQKQVLQMKKINDWSVLDAEYSSMAKINPGIDSYSIKESRCFPVCGRDSEKPSFQVEKKTSLDHPFADSPVENPSKEDVVWHTLTTVPASLVSQVRRRMDELNMKKPEEELNANVIFPDDIDKQEIIERRMEEMNRQFKKWQERTRVDMEKEMKEKNEIAMLKKMLYEPPPPKDDKFVKKIFGLIDSSEEDAFSDLDMEIIDRNEAASIPADAAMSPPLPPKNRFKFLIKRNPKPSPLAQSPDIGESKSTEMKDDSSSTEQPSQEPKNPFKFLMKRYPKPVPTSSESSGIGGSESTQMKENSSSTEMEDNSPSTEPPSQAPPMDVDEDPNPTVALRSSFTKYLEKNPESEWLATGATCQPCSSCSDKMLAAGNSQLEMIKQEIKQWLHNENV